MPGSRARTVRRVRRLSSSRRPSSDRVSFGVAAALVSSTREQELPLTSSSSPPMWFSSSSAGDFATSSVSSTSARCSSTAAWSSPTRPFVSGRHASPRWTSSLAACWDPLPRSPGLRGPLAASRGPTRRRRGAGLWAPLGGRAGPEATGVLGAAAQAGVHRGCPPMPRMRRTEASPRRGDESRRRSRHPHPPRHRPQDRGLGQCPRTSHNGSV